MLAAVAALLEAVTNWSPLDDVGRPDARDPASFEGLDLTHVTSRTGRLYFRRPARRDVDAIVALNREPSSMEANGWNDETANEHEAILRSPRFDNFAKLALVATLETGEVVGIASLATHMGRTDELSIGIHIHHEHSGKGIGTDLMAAIITATRTNDFTGPLWVGTAVSNIGLQRVMENLGHVADPGPTTYLAPNGQSIPSRWYRIP